MSLRTKHLYILILGSVLAGPTLLAQLEAPSTIYVGNGSFSGEYYNFYSDQEGTTPIILSEYVFYRGNPYTFERISDNGHPFYLSDVPKSNGSYHYGTLSILLSPSSGATIGQSDGIMPAENFSFTIPQNYSNTLHYYCTIPYHTRMVAALSIADAPDYLTFTLTGAGAEYSVTDCDQNARGSLVIPSTYNGSPVTSIGDYAFQSCTNLTSITIPDSVTSIGSHAFRECTSLTSILIPNGVTSIGSHAFRECTSLTSIVIPNGVTSISNFVFQQCTSLTSIVIPDSVTSIGLSSFLNCSSLASIAIPDSVTSIGRSAFQDCSSLATLIFEGDAPSIGTSALNSIQTPYIIVGGSEAASYGGDGATFGGLMVVDYSKVATAANLYTQSDYFAVVAERDAAEAERDSRLTMYEVRDLKLGSRMLEVVDGNASINIKLEATDNLGITNPTWTPIPESEVIVHPTFQNGSIRIDVQANDESNSGVKFFRFKMDGSNSSSDDIKLSVGESEYDRNAIIEALAEQYGVPASYIVLEATASDG